MAAFRPGQEDAILLELGLASQEDGRLRQGQSGVSAR
jgi:hypothetical protein